MFHVVRLACLVTYVCSCACQNAPAPSEAAAAGRAVTEVELADLIRDNLEPDLAAWQPARRGCTLSALDFLDLIYQIDTKWPEYRRNFIAIVVIQAGRMRWWSYPEARSWCTNRVQYIQEELTKYNDSYVLPDTMFVMNAYDKPLCVAGSCPAPLFSFNKPWQVPLTGMAVTEVASQEVKPARKLLFSDRPLWMDTKGSGETAGRVAGGTDRRRLASNSGSYTDSGNTPDVDTGSAADADADTAAAAVFPPAAAAAAAAPLDADVLLMQLSDLHQTQHRQLATTATAAAAIRIPSATMTGAVETAAATPTPATTAAGAWRWAGRRQRDGVSSASSTSTAHSDSASTSSLTKHFLEATDADAAATAAAAAVAASDSSALKKYMGLAASASPSSQFVDEQSQLVYDDVLFPVLNHPFEQLVYFPWEQKIHRAMMRAGLYPAMNAKCSRVRLYKIAQRRAGKGKLDVGIYKNTHWSVRVPLVSSDLIKLMLIDAHHLEVPPIPMEDHARWRYLISADGQGASWRLAKLLALNSVVLKARSDSIEYYYRSLVEGKDYISVDETDVVSVFDRLERTEQSQLQAITDSAQAFAHRYLSQVSRCAYAVAAIRRYTMLYSDMPRLLEELAGRTSSWIHT